MDLLPFNFQACRLCGMWYDANDYYLPKMAYRFLVLFLILHIALTQVSELIASEGSVFDLTEVLFLSLTFTALCFKVLNFLIRRSEMIELIKDFQNPVCIAESDDEKEIMKKCSTIMKKIFLFIMSLSHSTGLAIYAAPFFASKMEEMPLPFKSYHLYDTSNGFNYWITYWLQVVAAIYAVTLNVSMDTMVYGFLILTTGQFQISCYRLENSTYTVKDFINHHLLIQDIVYKIKRFFICVIVPLFFFSLITLCTSIFQMSQKSLASLEFLSIVLYLACMLFQIFLYCWFGNELELKSKAIVNAIYFSGWTNFTKHDRKIIWFIMLYAKTGSTISYHGQCSLSLNTFLWIIKTSYASLNVLKRASS